MFPFRSSSIRQLSAARRLIEHLAETCEIPISVRLWDGSCIPLGTQAAATGLTIAIRSPGVIGALLRWPTLDHMVRQYATGGIDIEGSDLITFGHAIRAAKKRPKFRDIKKSILIGSLLPFVFTPADCGEVQHDFKGENDSVPAKSRRDQDYIQFHYDIGNDFYKLFLGQEMVYSCGYFTQADNSIDQAQHDKLDMICRKLRLAPGEKMLDIGCGWGGLICHAAQHYGVHAHGVTLAQTQHDYVKEKIARAGLQDRVHVELKDYRDLDGTYDKIASIGMFEHVGIANMPIYFAKLNSLLRDRGILLNHGIARRAKPVGKRDNRMRPEKKLISKYIFPGGELDNIGHTLQSIEGSKFQVHDVEGWHEHYMLTTAQWCRSLTANREAAIKIVGPERYRLWVAYLAGVSFGFQDGTLQLFQVVASKHAKRGLTEIPLTRADLYEAKPIANKKVA